MFTSKWSLDEEAIVKAHYEEHGPHWVGWESLLPDRTEAAIQRKAGILGIKSKAPIKRKRPKKPDVTYVELRHNVVAEVTPDPMEKPILAMMRAGMTPAQIDRKMKWRPGKTAHILSEMWKRENQ